MFFSWAGASSARAMDRVGPLPDCYTVAQGGLSGPGFMEKLLSLAQLPQGCRYFSPE
jgi:hypothetical protein